MVINCCLLVESKSTLGGLKHKGHGGNSVLQTGNEVTKRVLIQDNIVLLLLVNTIMFRLQRLETDPLPYNK